MIYKGYDIESIKIKSDPEKGNDFNSNSRMRSYNYRIVYPTPDRAEIEMKGRCSAGQRVFSFIIIRLAPADFFVKTVVYLHLMSLRKILIKIIFKA